MMPRISQLERLALATAIAWWRGRRPQGWTLAQHLREPKVHCEEFERPLADALALLIEARRGERVFVRPKVGCERFENPLADSVARLIEARSAERAFSIGTNRDKDSRNRRDA